MVDPFPQSDQQRRQGVPHGKETDPATTSEAKFRALLESAPDAIVIVDQAGRIVLVNGQAEVMFGYPREQMIGQPVELLLPERFRAAHRDHRHIYADAPRTRPMGIGLELRGRRSDGSEFPVEISLSPLETEEGLLITSIIRDVTERQRMEQERRALLEQARAAQAEAERAVEMVQRLLSVSDTALAHLTLEELLADLLDRLQDALHADAIVIYLLEPESNTLVPRAVKGVAGLLESDVHVPVGRGFAGSIAAEQRPKVLEEVREGDLLNPLLREKGVRSLLGAPLVIAGRMIGVVNVGTLKPRRFDDDDVRLLQLAGDRIALAVENALLYREAQQAVQAREEFLSIAAHELKTPLTTVKGWVELLVAALRDPETVDAESIAMFAQELQGQVGRLEALIADLLDASRVQQRRLGLRPEPTDLAALAGRVLARFEHAPERTSQHTLVLDAPGPVHGVWDPDRLDQVLTNLISNALKYSPQGGDVCLRVGLDGDHATVVVTDQGIGISAEEQAQLFQPFARGEVARRTASGTGLGLYITTDIVEQHGGTLELESAPGAGTTVRVRLPLITPDGASPVRSRRPRTSTRGV